MPTLTILRKDCEFHWPEFEIKCSVCRGDDPERSMVKEQSVANR